MPVGAAAYQKVLRDRGKHFHHNCPDNGGRSQNSKAYPEGNDGILPAQKTGDCPTWQNQLSLLSVPSTLGFSAFDFTKFFDDIPTLIIYGDQAVAKDGAQRFYDEVKGPKELLVVEGSGHFELYWKPEFVNQAVEKIDSFLKE